MEAAGKGAKPSARVVAAAALVPLSAAWNAGNVGPVAGEIASDFDRSLGLVGAVTGSVFFGVSIVTLFFAARLSGRIGLVPALRLAMALVIGGNALIALTPGFGGLAGGRVVVGVAFALGSALGVVWVRQVGGVRLLGVFGASIQLGIAGALAVGSLLSHTGVDWRVSFVVSAALGVVALAVLPAHGRHEPTTGATGHFLRAALRNPRVYRTAFLFMAVYGVPMILGAWLVEYLVSDADLAKAAAGALGFVLFGITAAARFGGARLRARGVPRVAVVATLGLAPLGLVALALDPTLPLVLAAMILIAVGLGSPYATMLDEAQALYPQDRARVIALMTVCGRMTPAIAIPLVGHALGRGDGALAFGAVGAFVALALLANLRGGGAERADPG
jgi:predicted MFS family arabinose efflux permease